jgi:hypothetical protein
MEKLTLTQFSISKTCIFRFLPQFLFFFFSQTGNETADMFVHCHSIHLFLGFILQWTILQYMSWFLAAQTFLVLHQFLSFFYTHEINIHSDWVSLPSWEEWSVCCTHIWVVLLGLSQYSLHPPPVMVELSCPLV